MLSSASAVSNVSSDFSVSASFSADSTAFSVLSSAPAVSDVSSVFSVSASSSAVLSVSSSVLTASELTDVSSADDFPISFTSASSETVSLLFSEIVSSTAFSADSAEIAFFMLLSVSLLTSLFSIVSDTFSITDFSSFFEVSSIFG